MYRNILLKLNVLLLISFLLPHPASAQQLGFKQTELKVWQFSKDQKNWEMVLIPHSCNAEDGHSASYFRGKAYYKTPLLLRAEDLGHPLFVLFEGAAQASEVSVNGKKVITHRGGYTPFVVSLKGLVHAGRNEISIMCDNHEDVNLIPVSSDFNKNNGLHNPAFLLKMNEVYCAPDTFGLYRLHVSTPQVSADKALTRVETLIRNEGKKKQQLTVTLTLRDKEGNVCYENQQPLLLRSGASYTYKHEFTLDKPHLWNGLEDPYLYNTEVKVTGKKNQLCDKVSTKVGYRFYEMTHDNGFFLNGRHYPLRGVSMHQDADHKASAIWAADIDRDYKFVQEIGANFVRLAHYPHNDRAFRICDSLGIVVQTEIPWVNVCGVNAQPVYFETIHQQMREMISNLYNHPAIFFWGMWNELDSWGNNDKFQGKIDTKRIVEETGKLYDFAKSLDPYRCVGLTDDSQFKRDGYTQLKADYYSENRYNGWYNNVGRTGDFSKQIRDIHNTMGVTNVAEYGAGVNPYCHTTDTSQVYLRKDDTRHFEEYGNFIHETHLRQILDMPFLNFTSLWILFDFPVANRQEGFIDSNDGINFIANDARKYTNDKGLVTRDRNVKKDVFYLYKSWWNKKETTVHITSRRLLYWPTDKPIYVKVYSNAKSLTLYQNGQKVETKNQSGESSGLVWTFGPLKFQSAEDTFKAVADDGTTDLVSWKAYEKPTGLAKGK